MAAALLDTGLPRTGATVLNRQISGRPPRAQVVRWAM